MKANTEGSRDKSGQTPRRKQGERVLLTNMPLTWNLCIPRPFNVGRPMVSAFKRSDTENLSTKYSQIACNLTWLRGAFIIELTRAAPSVDLEVDSSRGEPTNKADYFLLLNNCPLSKILQLLNRFHLGVKQLLIHGAPPEKVSSIKQWTT